jgi:hypothetical protein
VPVFRLLRRFADRNANYEKRRSPLLQPLRLLAAAPLFCGSREPRSLAEWLKQRDRLA